MFITLCLAKKKKKKAKNIFELKEKKKKKNLNHGNIKNTHREIERVRV
jgi:hypothetical protein